MVWQIGGNIPALWSGKNPRDWTQALVSSFHEFRQQRNRGSFRKNCKQSHDWIWNCWVHFFRYSSYQWRRNILCTIRKSGSMASHPVYWYRNIISEKTEKINTDSSFLLRMQTECPDRIIYPAVSIVLAWKKMEAVYPKRYRIQSVKLHYYFWKIKSAMFFCL